MSNPTPAGVPNWILFLFAGSLVVGAAYGIFNHVFLGPTPINAYVIPTVAEIPPRTPENVQLGEELYGRACVACHGQNREGLVGPSLADAEWWHHSNEQDMGKLIMRGIAAGQSVSGQIMPPKGGAGISDADVWRVVYFLSEKNGSIEKDQNSGK